MLRILSLTSSTLPQCQFSEIGGMASDWYNRHLKWSGDSRRNNGIQNWLRRRKDCGAD